MHMQWVIFAIILLVNTAAALLIAIRYEGMKFSATFSAGVATFPEHGLNGEEMLQAADEALYRSKNGARNRVSMSAKSHA